MLTIELEHGLETYLLQIAQQEHQSPTQIISKLISQYIQSKQQQQPDLLVNFAKDLSPVGIFANKDPLHIQKEMRDEWH